MLPTNTNANTNGCSPVSSNCVIWQGGDLPCLNLCRGDSITEVVAKLATELCLIKESLNFSELELACLLDLCTGDPDRSLRGILTLLITKVCQITTPGDGPTPEQVNVTVAQCLRTNDTNGDPILQLSQLDYLQVIGVRLCSLITDYNLLNATVINHGTRIAILENAPENSYTLPSLSSVCLLGNATPQTIDDVLEALALQFCDLRTATGIPSNLLLAAAKQCTGLNSAAALSQPGTMSSLPGWKNTIVDVSDSFTNLWITVCDMRAAIAKLVVKTTLSCSDIAMGFSASLAGEGESWNVRIVFAGKTIIPSEFIGCTTNALLTIKDTSGHQFLASVDVVSEKNNPAGVMISLSSSTLNPANILTFTVEACFKNSTIECSKIATVTLPDGFCATPIISATIV